MKYNFWIFFISLVLLFIGCSNSRIDPERLIGRYCFNRNESDSILVYSNGKYTHKFITSEGKIYEAEGDWKYDSLENEIKFEDFVFFNNEGADNPPGLWYSKVNELEDGEVRLIYSRENNIYYFKNW